MVTICTFDADIADATIQTIPSSLLPPIISPSLRTEFLPRLVSQVLFLRSRKIDPSYRLTLVPWFLSLIVSFPAHIARLQVRAIR